MSIERQNSTARIRMPGALEVRLLGMVDLASAGMLQDRMAYELSGRRDGRGILLLCEHPPAISIGREGSRSQILVGDSELESCQMPVRWVSRSGGAIVHAPGQLAAYLLLPLRRLRITPGEFRHRFEAALVDVCQELRVPVKRLDHGPGLWTRGGQVGHFGAVVKSWVTQHGMWLNVHPEPGFLSMVRSEAVSLRGVGISSPDGAGRLACAENRVTSLQEQLLRRVSMHQAREAALRQIARAFEYDDVQPFTGHPELVRTRQQVCMPPPGR